MAHKLVVLGGTGFIGSAICRIAASEGHEIVSISRSGRPKGDAPWLDLVTWVEGNVLQPETWRDHLEGCHAVIHSVGIFMERPRDGRTYDRINDDSVEVAAWEAEHAGVERFVFLSVGPNVPFFPHRYLEAKQRGEQALHRTNMRHFILRPTFVYGAGRPVSLVPGILWSAAGKLPFAPSSWKKEGPLRVEQVAAAAVKAATGLDYEGAISPENIAYLAGSDWKAYALPLTTQRALRPYLLGGVALGAVAGTAAWAWHRNR